MDDDPTEDGLDEADPSEWQAVVGHGIEARCNACGAGTPHIEVRKAQT